MKRILIATLAFSMIAAMGLAQHMGPGGMGPGNGPGFDFGGPGGNFVVDTNGAVYVTDTVIDTGTRTATTTVKAISSSGSQLWSATVSNARGPRLSGPNLLFIGQSTGSDGSVSGVLTAISSSSGAVAWTQTVSGHITDLEPFNGGTYAIVVKPASTTGSSASRSLVALSNSGAILWTISL